MLDPDISTADSRRLLSRVVPDDEPFGPHALGHGGWTRRRFLQAIGLGVFGGAAVGTIAQDFFGGSIPEAWAGAPIGPTDGILVSVMLYGGNDSMNSWVPYSDPLYASKRPRIAISPSKLLMIDGEIGLAPELTYLKTLYDAGLVAAIQGVGYPNPSLSHFDSMAIWMSARTGGPLSSGWLGRWLDGQGSPGDLTATSIDTSVPLHMIGEARRGVAVSSSGDLFGAKKDTDNRNIFDGIRRFSAGSGGRGALHDQYATTLTRQLDLANDVAPVFANELPSGELAREMTIAARLINANLGLRVIDLGRGGFDNHDNEAAPHGRLMADLNTGLEAFFATLSPEFRDRVTVMTTSEFGRTVSDNNSAGTDHGTAATHFVIGSRVRGGRYGAMPSLSSLDRNGRLVAQVDFRSMYTSVLDGWMGGGASGILGGSFENLGLFHGEPGSVPPPEFEFPPSPWSIGIKTGYTALGPVRAFDTRDGTGGRGTPLGKGETWKFGLAGKLGIPADATAVALNVTAVDASAHSFVTVYPTGVDRPLAANLNPLPGRATPNLVAARLGADGAVNIYNYDGSVHLVADVVGYFSKASNAGLASLTPARLLDTRDGTGGFSAPVGPGETIDLQVTGRGGVSASANAVAINVTVTEPTADSYLTIHPAGTQRPLAASLNMVAGQTVPNMVIAGVGKDGKVSIYNAFGSTHVIVDVMGAFVDGASGKYVAVTPARALDTRDGTGAPAGRVAQQPLKLPLLGRAGVPSTGASAVLLNVTAVHPDVDTFVTAYPTDVERPLAANLNPAAGDVGPNMVLARLGKDGASYLFNFAGGVDLVADVVGYFT